jgi:hypothetical protein
MTVLSQTPIPFFEHIQTKEEDPCTLAEAYLA